MMSSDDDALEKLLPLKDTTNSKEKERSLLPIAICLFTGLILILFVVNYSLFSSVQNIYGFDYTSVDSTFFNQSVISNTISTSMKDVATTNIDENKRVSMQKRFNRLAAVASVETTKTPTSSRNIIWLDFCNLTDRDPWDSSILEYIQPEKDPMHNCIRTVFEHSKLINGQLFIYSKEPSNADEMHCRRRCLFPEGESHLIYGNWIKVDNGTKPECDIVEVECRKKSFFFGFDEEGYAFYKYLHAQIYRNVSRLPPPILPKPPEKYDVHIIVIDSISQTQFIRAMPKTLHVLREYYDAIPFHHLNKIGAGSVPNGFAFLFGTMIEDIPKSPFSRGYSGEHSTLEEACNTPLNESDQFIAFRFQDDGYITMMSDDWYTLYNYPNCTGFNKTVVDHYMRPFQLLFEDPPYKSKNMDEIVHEKSCRESYYDLMDYLKDFIKAYPDKPKFSISWATNLAHNRQNALSSSDDYFYHFFKDSIKDFENSFLFIMGDHGLRYGKMRETTIGEAEDNNPALFLSVPKPLRNDLNFMKQLRTNSKELITHYDIYATLVEITNPKNPRIPKSIIHGSSLFHPLPTPRTCDSLRIPFEYCICRSKKTAVKNDNGIGKKAAKMMVEQMNFELSNSQKVAKICSQLSLIENGEIIVEDYGGEQSERVYKITFSTTPGNGKFWGIVTYDPSNQKIQILSPKFARLNKYEFQAKCAKKVKSDLASYCYCTSWF